MRALFDIDGTLLEAPSEIHARAIERACLEVHGVAVEVPAVHADALIGLTLPMLGRLLLRGADLDDATIDAAAPEWRDAMTDAYLRLQDEIPPPGETPT